MSVKRFLSIFLLAGALGAASLISGATTPDYPALYAQAAKAANEHKWDESIGLLKKCLDYREKIADVYRNIGFAWQNMIGVNKMVKEIKCGNVWQ